MIDTDKYEGVKGSLVHSISNEEWKKLSPAAQALVADAPLLLAEVLRLREDYEKMSEVLRQHGMDICRHCRVIYRDDEISDYNPKNHPHYPSLHPWHMDGMCMKEMIE